MILRTWSQDPRVKFWTETQYCPEPYVDRKRLVGWFLPVLDNIELMPGMWKSFTESMPLNYPFAIIALDGGSTDGTLEWLVANMLTYSNEITSKDVLPENITGLVKPPTENVGVRLLAGDFDGNFSKEKDFGYIGYLHSDMKFPKPEGKYERGWESMLVELMDENPKIGIIGPRTQQCGYGDDKWTKEGFTTASVSPFFIRMKCLKEHYEKVGGLIDPELWFQIGYCDWDMHMRNMRMGWKSYIPSHIEVDHPMCGTRPTLHAKDPQRDVAFKENQAYYCQKWGVNHLYDPCKVARQERRIP